MHLLAVPAIVPPEAQASAVSLAQIPPYGNVIALGAANAIARE